MPLFSRAKLSIRVRCAQHSRVRDIRRYRERGLNWNDGVEGDIEGDRQGDEGIEAVGGGEVREGVDELDDEESQGYHSLRLHPSRHLHRHEF